MAKLLLSMVDCLPAILLSLESSTRCRHVYRYTFWLYVMIGTIHITILLFIPLLERRTCYHFDTWQSRWSNAGFDWHNAMCFATASSSLYAILGHSTYWRTKWSLSLHLVLIPLVIQQSINAIRSNTIDIFTICQLSAIKSFVLLFFDLSFSETPVDLKKQSVNSLCE